MKSRVGPVTFDAEAWKEFDFKRWNAKGLPVDEASASLADLVQQVFASDEWRENFAATLPKVRDQASQHFQRRADADEAKAAGLPEKLEQQKVSVRQQIEAVHDRMRRAASPPCPSPDENSFQLATKVLAKKTKLGLPGLQVRLMHSEVDRTLAEGFTNDEGNAVLRLNKEEIEALGGERTAATLEVLTPEGKSLFRKEGSVELRLNHVETLLPSLAASPELEPHAARAGEIKAEWERRITDLNGGIDRLEERHRVMLDNLNRRAAEARSIVTSIEEAGKVKVPPGGPAPPREPSPPDTQPEPDRPPPGKKEKPVKNPKFQLFLGEDGQHYFRLRARNGEIILASEGYTSKSGCRNGINSVKENALNDERYQRKTAEDSQPYFVLVAANGEPIGTSETYSSEKSREKGIAAVKKVAPDAPVEDIT